MVGDHHRRQSSARQAQQQQQQVRLHPRRDSTVLSTVHCSPKFHEILHKVLNRFCKKQSNFSFHLQLMMNGWMGGAATTTSAAAERWSANSQHRQSVSSTYYAQQQQQQQFQQQQQQQTKWAEASSRQVRDSND